MEVIQSESPTRAEEAPPDVMAEGGDVETGFVGSLIGFQEEASPSDSRPTALKMISNLSVVASLPESADCHAI